MLVPVAFAVTVTVVATAEEMGEGESVSVSAVQTLLAGVAVATFACCVATAEVEL